MFDFFDRWVKSVDEEMTVGGAKAQLQRSRIFCVAYTILLIASIGSGIVAFVLHKPSINKIIDASFIGLNLLLIVILWQFYFWIDRRVLEKARVAAIK